MRVVSDARGFALLFETNTELTDMATELRGLIAAMAETKMTYPAVYVVVPETAHPAENCRLQDDAWRMGFAVEPSGGPVGMGAKA